ncbi:MAG: hypothetical protein GH152_03720 [Dehalococcoidia bacterium]|nr:hypothetical protein [Dehalococcoidia bacterium]
MVKLSVIVFVHFKFFVFLVLKSLTNRQAIIYYEQVLSKLTGKISTRIASVALAIIIALIPPLLALAEGSGTGTITITATTKTVLEIVLNPTSWEIGQVGPNTEYKTNPEKTWCTMTNRGNCNINTYIKGEDAVWTESPSAYKWTLSDNGSNGIGVYVLWFRESTESSDTLITKTSSDFCPPHGRGSSLASGDAMQFGLKLKTPSPDYTKGGIGYFYGGGEMESHIIISGVAA